jgi:hypothetical protein
MEFTINDNTLNVTVLQCTYNLVITLTIFTITHNTLESYCKHTALILHRLIPCFVRVFPIRCLVCALLAVSVIRSSLN